MAIFNEKRNRVPLEVVAPTNGPGMRGQLRMLDNSTETTLYVCTTESSLTDPYKSATLDTSNGADITYIARAHGVAGDTVTVEHLATAPQQPLSVSFIGDALTVELETNKAGDSISNSYDVVTAVNTFAGNDVVEAKPGKVKGIVLPEIDAGLTGGVDSDAVWITHTL